ncbi:hypothetical protein BASA81_008020 [Batrachochytrium salamandrivorans]|nr:hypothetical protein BASA81_008020 [Batrachochytrium salamandrivorans]
MSGIHEDYESFLERNPDTDLPIAAVAALVEVMKRSKSELVFEFVLELRTAMDELSSKVPHVTPVALKATCELFLLYITRFANEGSGELAPIKSVLVEKGEMIVELSKKTRKRISEVGRTFIHDAAVILTHGKSTVVLDLLARAAETKNFSVLVAEGRPGCEGYEMAQALLTRGIPVSMVLDSAVASVMDRVDCVLVGAEVVLEHGGIVNNLGTFQIALMAKEFDKPFFVAVESYKFSRFFPLTQRDVPAALEFKYNPVTSAKVLLPPGADVSINAASDLTPPRLINLLFTDIGVFTPSAISDELTKMYQQ